jgi:hypothetical protein
MSSDLCAPTCHVSATIQFLVLGDLVLGAAIFSWAQHLKKQQWQRRMRMSVNYNAKYFRGTLSTSPSCMAGECQ